MRNGRSRPKFGLHRLARLLALATLAVGVFPVAAAGAEGMAVPRNVQVGDAPATTWSLVATLDPAHVQTSRSVLTLYGVYAFTPILVNFNPKVLGPSINQSAVPMYAVPDGTPRTYKVVFHLTTDVTATATTSYKLNDRTPVTVADGDADLEFIETVQGPVWRGFALRNASNDHWLFYSVTIYEQVS
jgi:hypothetical protein